MVNETVQALRLRAAIAAGLALALAAPLASAQDAQTDNFRLPPSTSTPRPTPSAAPTVAPLPTPTVAPTPTPMAAPSPSPTPAPSASPKPRPTPTARPSEPSSAPSTAPAALPEPTATAPAEPVAVPTIAPPPPMPTPSAAPTAEAAAPTSSNEIAWWVWAALAVVVLAVAGMFLRTRMGRTGYDAEASPWPEPEPAPSPTVSPPATLTPVAPPVRAPQPALVPPPLAPATPLQTAPPPTPPSAPAAPRSEGFLDVALAARRLSATLLNTSLSYELVVTNHGETPVGPIAVSCDMISAHASLPARLQLENPGQDEPSHRIPHLGPGESAAMAGELRLPLTAITPIRQGAAALFVPLARFRLLVWREGRPPVSFHRTFVIGETPVTPDAGLKPFRLDLGPRMYSSISQREVSLPA